jgi:rhodanese-related sulfurtransferase
MRFFLGILVSFLGLLTNGVAQNISKPYRLMLGQLYKNTVPIISCDELKKQPNVVCLDSRTKREYDVSHLPNARWVGYETFELAMIKDLPKTTPIVVYCSVGYRSERIGEKLLAAGYNNVRNLYGSLFAWVNAGNEVVDAQNQPTNYVHAYSKSWGVWLNKGQKVYE